MIGLYFLSRNLGTLPDAGGLFDQRADVVAWFAVLSAAETEYAATK